MDNRYLHRAKRTNTGEWIVGSLIQAPYLGSIRSWISSEQEDKARLREISSNQAVWRAFEVRTDTICQCLGATDKHKNLIWEHDVVLVPGEDGRFVITWSETDMKWEMIDNENNFIVDFDNFWASEIEVIGNEIDNPELVGSRKAEIEQPDIERE